ncbi:MAG: phosphatase PAP2 family protein [Acetobacteraceae bacterium]|nr:phosphatase PAP2 family protein [Acetobacteraceae bacterium]
MSFAARSAPPYAGEWVADVGTAVRAHTGLAAVVLTYVLIALTIGTVHGDANRISLWLYGSLFTTSTGIIGVVFLLGRVFYITFVVRPDQLWSAVVTDLRSHCLTRKRLLNALPVIALLSMFDSVFTSMKAMIPVLHPYDWDATLMTWDKAVHFGVAPWQALQPVLAYPMLTGVINVFYNLWLFVLAGCWFWQAFTERDQRLRMQFFVTFVLCFAILGNLVATLLASGGPCFYGHFVPGPDPYGPLLHYLHDANRQVGFVWSTGVQDMLWNAYATNTSGLGSGISAMPSMHVAGSTLFALLGWRTSRAFGAALTCYAAVIMLGSVHLGWHYAIDGYVGVFGTTALWWMVGVVVGGDGRYLTDQSARRRA